MPTFDTPEPISAVVDLVVGDVRITASDRDDTAVEIRPSDESHEPDVRAAEQTRVEYSAGQAGLSVNAWLVRAAAAALESGDRDRGPARRAPLGGQRYTGWVR